MKDDVKGAAKKAGPIDAGSSAGYTVLARRYRSRDFDELIGQEPIARTLRNAIASDRVAHAYLFCGTRGVGKTSMARIFAKALNLSDDLEQAEEIGRAILRGDDLDVIEIDGASNNGVQQARDLIAASGLMPARCRYRIYIIDEVHMLTTAAFNALLKTMEEPPSHVKFILCTTDPQKVPATIQSRCQRFDFRAIPTGEIVAQLKRVLESEGIAAETDLVQLVATLGNGSMRDALSLLDRLLAAGTEPLTVALAEEMLGIPDHTLVEELVDAIAAHDPGSALVATKTLLERGATVEQALDLVAEHLRCCLLVATCGAETDLLEVSGTRRETAVRHAGAFDAASLVYMMAVCDATARRARGATTARALLDAAVVRLCLAEQTAEVAALLAGGEKKKVIRAAGDGPRARGVAPKPRTPGARPPARPAAAPDRGATKAASEVAAASADPDLVEMKPQEIADADFWATVMSRAAARSSDEAILADYDLDRFEGGVLGLRIAAGAEDRARFLASRGERVADLVHRLTGRRVRIEIAGPAPATEQGATSGRTKASASKVQAALELPLVREAMEIFEGTVTDVREIE